MATVRSQLEKIEESSQQMNYYPYLGQICCVFALSMTSAEQFVVHSIFVVLHAVSSQF